MNQGSEYTEIYRAANFAQGGAVRDLLTRNGIECYMNPSVPTLPWDGDVRVLCVASEAARAKELVTAYFQAPGPEEEEEEDAYEDDDEKDEDSEEEEDDDDDD